MTLRWRFKVQSHSQTSPTAVAHASVCDVGEMHKSVTGRVSAGSGESLELEEMKVMGEGGGGVRKTQWKGLGKGRICSAKKSKRGDGFIRKVDKAEKSATQTTCPTQVCLCRECW